MRNFFFSIEMRFSTFQLLFFEHKSVLENSMFPFGFLFGENILLNEKKQPKKAKTNPYFSQVTKQ